MKRIRTKVSSVWFMIKFCLVLKVPKIRSSHVSWLCKGATRCSHTLYKKLNRMNNRVVFVRRFCQENSVSRFSHTLLIQPTSIKSLDLDDHFCRIPRKHQETVAIGTFQKLGIRVGCWLALPLSDVLSYVTLSTSARST